MDGSIALTYRAHEEKTPGFATSQLYQNMNNRWKGSVVGEECSLHQIAPYIGKIKSSMANALVSTFTCKDATIYDPFSGCGTIALEAWVAGRNIVANDLSPYAAVLTRAKLFPQLSLDNVMTEINLVAQQTRCISPSVDLRKVPGWVRSFFHPTTLREIIAWSQALISRRSYFLLSCLLGILHHQRPGFLSYPSSHTVPYLRQKRFPRDVYPALYEYRPVRERLQKKVVRALTRIPLLDARLKRRCYMYNAAKFVPRQKIDAIITSPPYMRQLDYGRDNRLRLWSLGVRNWKLLDKTISPSEKEFFDLLSSCLKLWHHVLTPQGLCVLVLGDTYSRLYKMPLPEVVDRIATREIGGYSVLWRYSEPIPNARRVRRGCRGSLTETILVLRNDWRG
jgi:hypothetical protein